MKFGIIIFPGTNCERDCKFAISRSVGQESVFIWHKEASIPKVDCVVIPGGFSYGDYLRTGAIARYSPIMTKVTDYALRGGLVLGICNGFQILLEAGLLPGAMLHNRSLRFICKNVHVTVENSSTPFTEKCVKGQILKMPIRHGEGNYYIDAKGLKDLEANNQIVFKYCSPDGDVSDRFNPNGAVENIAGICSRDGNILGLMPHPEAACDKWLGSTDGKYIFSSICK